MKILLNILAAPFTAGFMVLILIFKGFDAICDTVVKQIEANGEWWRDGKL